MFCQTKPKNFCFEFLCSCKTTVLELSTSLFSDPCHCLHIQFQYLPEAEAVAVSAFLHRLNICSHCCVWSKELRTGRSHARATRRLSAGLQLTPNRDPALTGSSHKLLGLPQNFVKPYLQIKYSLCPATVIKIKRNLANNPLVLHWKPVHLKSAEAWNVEAGSPASPQPFNGLLPTLNVILMILPLKQW